MPTTTRLGALLLLACVLACGPDRNDEGDDTDAGSTGANSVTGMVNGTPITALSAISSPWTVESEGAMAPPGHYLTIRVSESAEFCNPDGFPPFATPGRRIVALGIERPLQDGKPGVGTHEGGLSVERLTDDACASRERAELAHVDQGTATITITAMSPTVRGTFTGTLNSGAELRGSFDAIPCSSYDWERYDTVACKP